MPPLQAPLDPFPYERDPRSQPLTPGIEDGTYVYLQDEEGTIRVLPDGPHLHPKILGRAAGARYAGDLRIKFGNIHDVTNLSGSFQFNDPQGLVAVAAELERLGFTIVPDGIRFFPLDGSPPYVIIR